MLRNRSIRGNPNCAALSTIFQDWKLPCSFNGLSISKILLVDCASVDSRKSFRLYGLLLKSRTFMANLFKIILRFARMTINLLGKDGNKTNLFEFGSDRVSKGSKPLLISPWAVVSGIEY
jgi:hypothetical protein